MKHPIQRKRLTRLLSALLILALGLPTPSAQALRTLNAGAEESPVQGLLENALQSAAGLEEDVSLELDSLALKPGDPVRLELGRAVQALAEISSETVRIWRQRYIPSDKAETVPGGIFSRQTDETDFFLDSQEEPPLRAIRSGSPPLPLIPLGPRDRAMVPVSSRAVDGQPFVFGAYNHITCICLLGKGVNDQGQEVLLQWHIYRTSPHSFASGYLQMRPELLPEDRDPRRYRPEKAVEQLMEEIPHWLAEQGEPLYDIELLISPQTDVADKMDPSVFQRAWQSSGVKSVLVVPRAMGERWPTGVYTSSVASAEGIGLFIEATAFQRAAGPSFAARESALETDLEALDRAAERFHVIPWGFPTGKVPALQIPAELPNVPSAAPHSGLEEPEWMAEMRNLLSPLYGDRTDQLSPGDLRILRQARTFDELQRLLGALSVALGIREAGGSPSVAEMMASFQIQRFLYPWPPADLGHPGAMLQNYLRAMPNEVSKPMLDFLSGVGREGLVNLEGLDRVKRAISKYVATAEKEYGWALILAPLIEPDFTPALREQIRQEAAAVLAVIDPRRAEDEAGRAVSSWMERTLTPNLDGIIRQIDATPGARADRELSLKILVNGINARLFGVFIFQSLGADLPLWLVLSREGVPTDAAFLAKARHEFTHLALEEAGLTGKRFPEGKGTSNAEDWITMIAETAFTDPRELGAGVVLPPTLLAWLRDGGREMASRPTAEWSGRIIGSVDRMPLSWRFYAEGTMAAGVAERLAEEISPDATEAQRRSLALQFAGRFARYADGPITLDELGPAARAFRSEHGLPEDPAAGLEESSRRRIPFADGLNIFVTEGQFAPDDSARLFLDLFQQHPDWLEGDILELGTGTGALSILLARHGRSAVGLDIQPQAVADAEFNKANQPDDVRQRLTFGVSDVYQNLAQVTGDPQRRFDAAFFVHPIFIGENFSTSRGEVFETAAYAGPEGEVVRRAVEGLPRVLKPGKSGFFFAASENKTNLNVLGSDGLRAMLPDARWRMDPTGVTLNVPERYRQGGEYLEGHILYEVFRITPPESAYAREPAFPKAGTEEMDPMYVREAVQGLYQFPALVEKHFGKDGAQPASWAAFLEAAGRESSWTWDGGLGSFWKLPQKTRQGLAYRSLRKLPVPLRLSVGGELVLHNQREGVLLLGENGAEPSLLAIFMTGDPLRGWSQHSPWEWIFSAQKNEHTWTYLGGNGDLLVLEFPQGLYAGRVPRKNGQYQPLRTRFPLEWATEVPVHEGSFEGRAFQTEIEGKNQFVPLKGVVRFSRNELMDLRTASLPSNGNLSGSLQKLPAQDLFVDISQLRWRNNWDKDPERKIALQNLQAAVRTVEDFFVPQFSAGAEQKTAEFSIPPTLSTAEMLQFIHNQLKPLGLPVSAMVAAFSLAEYVSNVVEHGKSTQTTLALAWSEEEVRVTVRDNQPAAFSLPDEMASLPDPTEDQEKFLDLTEKIDEKRIKQKKRPGGYGILLTKRIISHGDLKMGEHTYTAGQGNSQVFIFPVTRKTQLPLSAGTKQIFVGTAEPSMDGNNQFYLPAKWQALRDSPRLTVRLAEEGDYRYLAIYPPADGAVLSSNEMISVDKRGRIRIRQGMAEWAQVGWPHQAVLLGVGDHVELWNKPAWEGFLAAHDGALERFLSNLRAGAEQKIDFSPDEDPQGVIGYLLEGQGLPFAKLFALAAAQGHRLYFAGVAARNQLDGLAKGLPAPAEKLLRERIVVIDGMTIEEASSLADGILQGQVPMDDRETLQVLWVDYVMRDLLRQINGYLRMAGLRFSDPVSEQNAAALLESA